MKNQYFVEIECLGKSGTLFPCRTFFEANNLFEQYKDVSGKMKIIQRCKSAGEIILRVKEA